MTILGMAILTGIMLLAGCGTVQNRPVTEGAVQDKNDIYIPENLDDCFVQLKKLLKPEDIDKMKAGTEDDMTQYHFGLGMGMRNGWELWGGSRLAKWFNAQGITHPDDMSGIILDSFWRHLNEKPINLEQQVKYYQDYWKKQKEARPSVGGDEEPAPQP